MSKVSTASNRSRSTLQDVARVAGVSPSTVSSVLAGNAQARRISQKTYEHVQSVAAELGYTPNLLHRSIRRGRTNVISLFNAFRTRERGDLYLDRITGAIEQAGGELGYDILVHTNFNRGVEETYEFLNGGFADGLVLFGSTSDDPLLPLLRQSYVPTVLINPRQEDEAFVNVTDDEAQGMREIAKSLVQLGHKNVAAVVESVGGLLDPTGRLRRLRNELVALELEFDERNVVIWNDAPHETIRTVREMKNRPTALFVWHDRNAYRLVEACSALGVRVPEELSIVGYDGILWPSTSPHVVASVEVPVYEMAEVGLKLLDQLISGDRSAMSTKLPVKFKSGTTLGHPNDREINPTKDHL